MAADLYQQALEQARTGHSETALESFELFLKQRPDHGCAWNDAGAVLYSQGRVDEAIRYFRRAIELENRPPRVFRNLAKAYLAAGHPSRAMQGFEAMRREGLLDAAMVAEIADAFSARDDLASAMDVLCRGRQALPQAEQLDRRIEMLRGRRAKIAFFWGGDGPAFLNDILNYARQRYDVRTFDGKTAQDMYTLMQWSDISWFEWCTELVVLATKLPKVCRTIVRLHRWEAYNSWPAETDWSNVDLLMTVGNSVVRQALEQQVPDIQSRTSLVTIPNGVDVDKFKFRIHKKGKKIVQLGHLRMIKRPDFALQCMKKLHAIDKGYHLHFAGWWQDHALQQYLLHMTRQLGLEEVVHFDGYQTNVQAYLEDFDYNLSCSLSESQGMGLLEAMARGIKPVIHHFPGAEEIFGREYLFHTPEDFCRLICESDYTPEKYREFVERRYPLSGQLVRINELFALFERNPWTDQAVRSPVGVNGLSSLLV